MPAECTGNPVWCKLIVSYGMLGAGEPDSDSPDALYCERCEKSYALSREDSTAPLCTKAWERQVTELREAVTSDHDIGHATLVFLHNGSSVVNVYRRPPRRGRWIW